MAELKKRGFHALEQRIHEMEEEDAKQQSTTQGTAGKVEAPAAGSTKPRQEPKP